MRRVFLLQYTCKPHRAEENEQLIRGFLKELHEVKPGGIRYATFRLDDVHFAHLVITETKWGLEPLGAFKSYAAIQHGKSDRFAEGPDITEWLRLKDRIE